MLSLSDNLPPCLDEGGAARLSVSVDGLASILQKCSKERNLAQAVRLQADIRRRGLEAHPLLGDHLITMLAEVGSVNDAQQVFDRLASRKECSWNSLITGYIRAGDAQRAFSLYHKMRVEDASLSPDPRTYVALLKACAMLKDLQTGCQLHAHITQERLLERDIFVGSCLVSMYGKCGLLAKAQEVFDNLPFRNVVSWNALLAGYAQQGYGEEALTCFERMKLEGIYPNAVTFVCSLKACGSIGAAAKGQKIHAEISKQGLLVRDFVVGSALVDMYAKCGLFAQAEEVFERLPARNVVVWTSLIAGYTKHGHGKEALNCFESMQLDGISPNAITFACSLKACGSIRAIGKGQQLHAEISRKGLLEKDSFVGNALVDMYAKCGLLEKAHEIFDMLSIRNVISWNAMISGHAQYGDAKKALKYFDRMHVEGLSPDPITFVCSLKACGTIGDPKKGQEIHSEILRERLETNALVGSALVDMYAKCGLLARAQEVFDNLAVPDIVSWTALIAGYVQHGHADKALTCFERMQLEGLSPDAVTFACILKACGSIGAIGKGEEIHLEVSKMGLLESDIVVGNALLDMYAKCGLLAKAKEVFDLLLIRDIVSWSTLIQGYAENGLGEEALVYFEQMRLEGLSPDAVMFICSLKACASIGALKKGQEIHDEISAGGPEVDILVGNALIDMYTKCGSPIRAQEVFEKLKVRNVVSWNVLIGGYAQLGEIKIVLLMFDKMINEDIKPDSVTFISILNVCSHTGLVIEGCIYFEAIGKNHGIVPTIEHHTCMVDLLGRAGQLQEAVAVVKAMALNADAVVWRNMLGACQKWGNFELGRQAFEHAVRLDEKHPVAYVCMSNLSSDASIQKNARKAQSNM